jgi:hypothetical protein
MVLPRISFSRNKKPMQHAMRFLVVCAATISLSSVTYCRADTDVQIKAREALEKRLNEIQGQPAPAPTEPAPAPQPPPSPVPPPAPPAAKPVVTPAPVTKSQPVTGFSASLPPPADPEVMARTRAALEKRLNELGSQPEAAPNVTASQPSVRSRVAVSTAVALPPPKLDQHGFVPLARPESPLSPDKQQRLAELLRKYRADEVSPEQYHAERAKILAEP